MHLFSKDQLNFIAKNVQSVDIFEIRMKEQRCNEEKNRQAEKLQMTNGKRTISAQIRLQCGQNEINS